MDGSPVPDAESRVVEVETEHGPVEVRYLGAGAADAPPAVFVHGIGLDSATVSWRYALGHLAEDYRAIAVDLPGHGESEKPVVRYTTRYFIDVLAGFLETLDLREVRLAGVSMGGAIALGYALEHDRVVRLALVDSYGLGDDAYWRGPAALALRTPFVPQLVWRSLGASRATVAANLEGMVSRADPQFVDDVYEAVQDGAVGRTLSSWQRSEFRFGGLETDYVDRLEEFEAPTLLVHGAADPLCPPEWSERAADRLPNATLSRFEGCGHWPPRERPAQFNRRLASFFGRSAPPAADD